MKYRLNWRNNNTSATGHGEPIFTNRKAAQAIADQLNQQDRDIQLYHWVEAVPDKHASLQNHN